MRRLSYLALFLNLVFLTQAEIVLENPLLKVSIDEKDAHLQVLEKKSGTLWGQPSREQQESSGDRVKIRRAPQPPVIDGDPEEWAFIPHEEYVWLPWKGDNGEANCSGGAKLMWDDEMIYLYMTIRDDNVAFGGESTEQWWESDSLEFWIDHVQVGLHLAPKGAEKAVNSKGEEYAGCKIGVQMITGTRLPGYRLEVAMPRKHFPILEKAGTGCRFSFAVGMNDADPENADAPIRRARQSYSPQSWVHSTPATFSQAVLQTSQGEAPKLDEKNDRTANAGGGTISNLRLGATPNSVEFDYALAKGQLKNVPLRVSYTLVENCAALDIALTYAGEPNAKIKNFTFPPALYPEKTDEYFLAVASYANGSYLPVSDPHFRRKSFSSSSDLPFIAVTNGRNGMMLTKLTPWDMGFRTQVRQGDDSQAGFPGFYWEASKGTWGKLAKRIGRIWFYPTGGHVKAAKLYREQARQDGFLKTLREKEKENPDTRKLLGAVNWWGGNAKFQREALAAGVSRGLLNGRPNPKDMQEIVDSGWLAGEYDNYEDINDSPEIARAKAPVKEHGLVNEDGSLATAWITRDKDMKPIHTYMKQCTGTMLKCAKIVIPKVLETYPYNARFLDVTTACHLRECWSPTHGADRTKDVQNRQALCNYVSSDLNLVTGGEHGKFWDVPFLHYHEGMMGGGNYTWPAGYLRKVTEKEQVGERYLKYGSNPANRVPLFELVFHDCIVNYWYWGATNDYLHKVAPKLTDRKTALNVLYGTPPMMWVYSHGLSWSKPEEREKMLEIYRNVCKLHEIIGDQELLSHEFISADRMVQRSQFADGTTCTVNFGETAFAMEDAGKQPLSLRENDFYVTGPQIEEWRLTIPGTTPAVKTFIKTGNYLFIDIPGEKFAFDAAAGNGRLQMASKDENTLQITLAPNSAAEINLFAWQPKWRQHPNLLAAFLTDKLGNCSKRLPPIVDGKLSLKTDAEALTAVVYAGEKAKQPDLDISRFEIEGGKKLKLSAQIINRGLSPAENFTVSFFLDSVGGMVVAKQTGSLEAGGKMQVDREFDTTRADGNRRIIIKVEGETPLTQSGSLERFAKFTGPIDKDKFSYRKTVSLTVPPGNSAGMPIEQPLTLPAGIAPENLRILFPGKPSRPAQFEAEKPGAPNGILVFTLPENLVAGTSQALLLGCKKGETTVLPHSVATSTDDEKDLQFGNYSASFMKNTLTSVAYRTAEGERFPIIKSLVYSSKETSWSREDGEILSFARIQNGPVRSVFHTEQKLVTGMRLTRTWLFYADRFEVRSETNPGSSCRCRAFFSSDAIVTNQLGKRAVMDAQGDGEGMYDSSSPYWYAAFAPDWSLTCIALSPVSGFVYWDGGNRGQISLNSPSDTKVERRLFILGPGSDNDDFAKKFAEAYASPSPKTP